MLSSGAIPGRLAILDPRVKAILVILDPRPIEARPAILEPRGVQGQLVGALRGRRELLEPQGALGQRVWEL